MEKSSREDEKRDLITLQLAGVVVALLGVVAVMYGIYAIVTTVHPEHWPLFGILVLLGIGAIVSGSWIFWYHHQKYHVLLKK